MKKLIGLFVVAGLFAACNNSGKDSVEKADSVNEAIQDTAVTRNQAAPDEASSSFLVRVANSGMAEVQVADMAQQKAQYQPVKDFAGMLQKAHTAVNDEVKALALNKNIVLPSTLSEDKQKMVTDLSKKTGKDFDKEFVSSMVHSHEQSIRLFEDASRDVKDADVKAFADKTLPALRIHLDSAKALKKRYW